MPRTSLRSRLEAAEAALAKFRERDAKHTIVVPVRIDDVALNASIEEFGRRLKPLEKRVAKLRASVTVTVARLTSALDRIDDTLEY